MKKPDLNTERMIGFGDYMREGHKVNKLFGLDDFCKKYITKESSILELGCNNGISTSLFCFYAKKVVGVDIMKKNSMVELINSSDNLTFHNTRFEIFFKNENSKYDVIYIDGAHDYQSVVNDIKNSLKILKEGGVLSGHDFYEETGVPKAVKDFFNEEDLEIFSDSTWAIRVKKDK